MTRLAGSRRRRGGWVLAVVAAGLAGCSSGPPTSAPPTAGAAGSARSQASSAPAATATTLTVYAAASLRTTFTRLAREFEATHPGTSVTLTFAGSSDLVAQLDAGAPGDVLATADEPTMAKAEQSQVVAPGSSAVFATNTLTMVTPPGNPAHVTSFADLARPGLNVVVCAPQVPCGHATQRLEHRNQVTLSPASEENSVTDVLGKVTSGQADAGLVYVTDARQAGERVSTQPVPHSSDVVSSYAVAATSASSHPDLAAQFAAFVRTPQARTVLTGAGFGAPTR